MLETTKRVWLTEIPVFAVSISRKFMRCHALLSPVQPKPIHCLICRAGSWDRTVLDHFLDVLVVCVFFHPNNWTQVKLRSKSRTWTWGGNWLAPGSLYYYVQFIWEANHVAKRHVLFSSFDQFQWFVCVWLTESRASKNLMLDDHSYIDMAINGIPHVHSVLGQPPVAEESRLVMRRWGQRSWRMDLPICWSFWVILLANLNHLSFGLFSSAAHPL